MQPQLSIEALWHDTSAFKILFKASNGRFSGTATLYTDVSAPELIDLGKRLHGFPKTIDQVEEQEFGFTKEWQKQYEVSKKLHPEIRPAAAYVCLKFLCIDPLGHTAVDITIHEDPPNEREEAKGKASFEMRFEAAQVDSFANALIALSISKEGSAVLQGIYDGRGTYLEN